jgi:hypothetical protein
VSRDCFAITYISVFPVTQEETVSKERLLAVVSNTDLFNQEEHRRALMDIIVSYIREVRTRDIRC